MCSRCAEGDIQKLRTSLAMLEALRYNPKRKGLHPSLRFILSRAVGEYARQVGDLGDPATVLFSLEFHLERHAASVATPILAVFVVFEKSAEHRRSAASVQ